MAVSFSCSRLFLIYYILSLALTTFFTQPQPLLVFLQSEAGSNNKTKLNHVSIKATRKYIC